MNPQEIIQEIQSLRQELSRSRETVQALSNDVRILKENSGKLNRMLDQNSRDVINRTVRDWTKQLPIIVAAAFTLLPQSNYLLVSGTATRTSSTTKAIDKGSYYGQILIIEGTDNTNTIIIKDAAGTQLAGDCTLGIYDTLTVQWNGTYWVELARSNN